MGPDWLAQNGHPFPALAEGYLCPQHRAGAAPATSQNILSAIKVCCARGTDFLSPHLPLLETVFRLLLSEGNQPTSAEGLA